MKASKSGGKRPPSADVDANVDQPRLPWTSRLWSSVGLPWMLTGFVTYTFLTMLGRQFLHSPKGLEVLREEVPFAVHDRSMSIFLTALAIDLLNIVFERQTIKLDCVLLPAFIKGMASTTNIMIRFFTPVMILTDAGRPVVVQRYICWMHTTPSILLLLKMISSTITAREATIAIIFDEIMVVTGVLALMTTGWQRVLWAILTHAAMLPVVPYMHKAFTECMGSHRQSKDAPLWSAADARARGVVARAMEQVRTRPLQLTMLFIYVLNLILWCTFAVTWDLALLGWISILTEEVLYLSCDFSAKVLFSSTLMLSSFKEFEARRESAMRVIEGSSKAKLITELQALLEQKERFMSSVSHELRTPLNGIIGISEGMLSGCCGVLPEGVRRQIYIIRTSGARLLALINDVMDAAALRQNKLVLKQEQVVLRHVVDDVLDLTRSLVDTEVQLTNLTPPRMLVMGDTGRIVQILNNLLGNAAKFTRRGQIRVTARQVESGRRVAVTVSDTGIGIPRNKLATIFLPFEQVDMSISRKYGGFGLGLNIVQELVKAHGGTINVSSIEGKGSAFTFTLPLARAMGRESLEEAKAAAARGSLAITQDGGGGGRIGIGSSVTRGGGSGVGTGTGTGTASATFSGVTPRLGDGGGDDSSTIVSSSDASRRPGRPGGAGTSGAADSELEQYGELMYNAAELSALASSRPYAQSARDSLPASLEGGPSPAGQSPLLAAAGSQGGGALLSHPRRASRAGKTPSAAGGGDASGGGGASGGDPSKSVNKLPGGDAKIVHGPRPFHYTMYKRFLLLSVDDDHVNQSVVKSLLGSTGYEVVAVPSGPEALRYFASAPALPDLVLLDCMMPEMDGYEVLQRLRAMTPNVHVPIIMVSAQTEEEHVVCGLDLGADDYVTKPFKRNELLARIRAQLAYGEWEHDNDALETISSLVAAGDFNGGSGLPPANSTADSAGGNGAAAAGAAAAAAAMAAASVAAAVAGGGGGGELQRSASVAGGGGGSDSFGGEQRLIVCIDDDDVNQVVLQGMLTSQQYRYVRASTGAQGLSYVCGTHNGGIPPDLVLLDCSLPDMTGFDVCRCIRQMYNKQQVPIIMLSARHNESAVVEGLKCGASTYVTKPFRRNELLARIRLHLRSREPLPGQSPSQADSGPGEDSDPRVGHTAIATLAEVACVRQPVTGSSLVGMSGSASVTGLDAAGGGGGASTAVASEGADGGGGVRIWPEAAVLVVAVADYSGLCRMLMPAEMAELSTRMAAAFDRAIVAYGAVRIEASSGVMSAAVLPSAPAPLLPPGADAEAINGAASAAAAAAGLRLAALHRVGRALLEAAAVLAVPGTSTCLQLQEALALGTIMGHCTAPAAGSKMLYFGPVLAELLDLARRAPPMTIVSPDGEAQALRASGATADIRGPLFLESEDGGDGGGGDGGGGDGDGGRRLWLVEAHPFAHQYLPPQLLYSSSVMRGSFFQRSAGVAAGAAAAAAATAAADDPEKGSGSVNAASVSLHLGAAIYPYQQYQQQQQQSRMLSAPAPRFSQPGAVPAMGQHGGGGGGGAPLSTSPALARQFLTAPGGGGGGGGGFTGVSGSPLSTQPTGAMTPPEFVHGASASINSAVGFNASLGLYGLGGYGLSRAASRALSQTYGADSDAVGRSGPQMHQSPPQQQQQQPVPQYSAHPPSSTNGGSISQASAATGGGGGAAAGSAASGGTANGTGGGGGGGGGGNVASLGQHFGVGAIPPGFPAGTESTSGGPCITFSLQAAAAAVAAATAAASNSGHFLGHPDTLGGLMTHHQSHGTAPNSMVGLGGLGSSVSAAGLPGTSFLYGSGQRPSSNVTAATLGAAAAFVLGGGGGGGASAHLGSGVLGLDSEATAAEPQIRALRNELAVMRMQLEALQSTTSRDSMPLGPASLQLPHPQHQQQLGPSQAGAVHLAPAAAASVMSPLRHGPVQPGQQQQQHQVLHQYQHQQRDGSVRNGGGGGSGGLSNPAQHHHYTQPYQQQQQLLLQQQQQQQQQQLMQQHQQQQAGPPGAPMPPPSSAESADGVRSCHPSAGTAGAAGAGAGEPDVAGASQQQGGKAAKKVSKLSRLFSRSGKGGAGK